MGGAIVQAMALSRAEMIKGIVLVGTGARLKVFAYDSDKSRIRGWRYYPTPAIW